MCATMGGRAAEKVVFDNISTGALSDLEKVTKQAKAMVTIYGLSEEIGNITYYDSQGQNDYAMSKPYSEETAVIIDKEISKIIEGEYARAISLLAGNRDKLDALANILLEKEVIFRENVQDIFGKRPWDKEEEVATEEVSVAEEAPAVDTESTQESEIQDVESENEADSSEQSE